MNSVHSELSASSLARPSRATLALWSTAFAVGSIQFLCSLRFGAVGSDYATCVALAWGATLWLATHVDDASARFTPRLFWEMGGWAVAMACVSLLSPRYHASHRLLPLVAGAGFLFLGRQAGIISLPISKSITALSLPLIHPVPESLRHFFDTVPLTARVATLLLNGAGLPALREENLITLGSGQVIVQPLCSGWTMIGQLLALALFACCLFSAGSRQKMALFAAALGVGFFVNSARVAVLTVLAGHPNPDLFDIWDHGLYSPLFSVIAVSLGGLTFWTILREPALGTTDSRRLG